MDYRVLLVALLVLPGCSGPESPGVSEGSYYEIVWMDYDCPGGICFLEYIVTDTGLVLRKEIRGEMEAMPSIEIRSIPGEEAMKRIGSFGNGMPEGDDAMCKWCAAYHLFHHKDNQTKWHTVRSGDADGFVLSAMRESGEAFVGAERWGGFFVHLIYSKEGATKDIHVFSDGTVIEEDFGGGGGKLLGARLARVETGSLEGLVDGLFDSTGDSDECARRGYEYSYIEAGRGGRYVLVETCGAGGSGADRMFNEVMELVGQ